LPENNITQTPESQLTPPLQQRGIGEVILLASFIIGIMTGLLAIGMVDVLGFVVGCINFVFALPFALVTALIYRKTQLTDAGFSWWGWCNRWRPYSVEFSFVSSRAGLTSSASYAKPLAPPPE
jgi:hypothetical protein